MRDCCASCQFVDALHDGVLGVEDHHVSWSNRSARMLLGMDPQGMHLRDISSLTGPIPESGRAEMFRLVKDQVTQLPHRIKFPIEFDWLRSNTEGQGDGTFIFLDVTRTANLEEYVKHTYRDSTGLLSAEGFRHLVDQSMRREPDGELNVVLAIGVKWGCEEATQAARDEVDADFAKRIVATVRGRDLTGRDGDVFYVMLWGVQKEQNIHSICERIAKSVGAPFYFGGELKHVDVAIGVACHPLDGKTASVLMDAARTAIASARNGVHFANPDLQRKNAEEVMRIDALRTALRTRDYEARSRLYAGANGHVTLYSLHVECGDADGLWRLARDEKRLDEVARHLAVAAAQSGGDVVIDCPEEARNIVSTVFNVESIKNGKKNCRLWFLCRPGMPDRVKDCALRWEHVTLKDIHQDNPLILAEQADLALLPEAMREAVKNSCNVYFRSEN